MRSRTCSVLISALVVALLLPARADAAPTDALEQWEYSVLALPNGAIESDPTRDVVLVAVADEAPVYGNHVIELDPETGAIGRSVFVGSDPVDIAVADDGSVAYVARRSSVGIAEIDLATFTLTREFGTWFPRDVEVQPGHPEVVAAASTNKVAVFEDGQERPNVVTGHGFGVEDIEFGVSSTLYASGDWDELYVVDVGDDGAQLLDERELLHYDVTDIEWAGGRLTTTSGQAIDPTAGDVLGTYELSGPVEVDPVAGNAFIIGGAQLGRFATATFLPTGSLVVPARNWTELVATSSAIAATDGSEVLLAGPDVTGTGYDPRSPFSALLEQEPIITARDANALAAGPGGDTVFAALGADDPDHPYEVVEIDLATGGVVRSVFVGADPFELEVSGDGSTLLVGHRLANRVTEIDLDSFDVARVVRLPHETSSRAFSIAPVPGAAASYVIAPCCNGYSARVVTIVDGVVQPRGQFLTTSIWAVVATNDPNRIYAAGGHYALVELGVLSNGVTEIDRTPEVFGLSSVELEYGKGRLFASDGTVIEPLDGRVVGSIPPGLVAPDPAHGRVWVLDYYGLTEIGFDELNAVSELRLPITSGGRAIEQSGDHLVVASQSSLVFLGLAEGQPVEEPQVPPPPTDPYVVPTAPRNVTVRWPANGSAVIEWEAPAGGTAVWGYDVTTSPAGPTCSADRDGLRCDLAGLDPEVTYTAHVSAWNPAGTGPVGSSEPFVPSVVTGPSAPREVKVTAHGTDTLLVSFVPSLDDGGRPITEYSARCWREYMTWQPRFGYATTSPIRLSGFDGGYVHHCVVEAANGFAPGTPSATISFTPRFRPTEPTEVRARPRSQGARVSWEAPPTSGGAPIEGYRAKCTSVADGTTRVGPVTTNSAQRVRGLRTGMLHRCHARAVNGVGAGPWSPAVEVTPT